MLSFYYNTILLPLTEIVLKIIGHSLRLVVITRTKNEVILIKTLFGRPSFYFPPDSINFI